MKELGSVALVRYLKKKDSGAIWVGSMQKEFVVSPTTLDGCVTPVQATPLGFSYKN
jgi:hypothetical protein